MEGKRIGNYRVVRQIGKGGMGAVFEAVHDGIGKRVAIKILHAKFAQDPHIAGRFLNEARVVSAIEHVGIVQVFDFGQPEGGAPYIVMELLQGESLSRRLKRAGPLPISEALRIGRQMAAGLAAAHTQHVVHRDLKPSNVLIVPDPEAAGGERAKILDFGIAKLVQEPKADPDDDEDTEFQTHSGMLIGTPTYMSPEQCRGGGDVDERSDVYSLGILFYQMLSGRPPFIGEGEGAVLAMQIYEQPRPLLEQAPGVPPAVAALVGRMLLKDPAARPAMITVARELEALGSKMSGVVSAVMAPGLMALEGPLGGGAGSLPWEAGSAPGAVAAPGGTTGHGIGERMVLAERAAGQRKWALAVSSAVVVAGVGVWAALTQDCSQRPGHGALQEVAALDGGSQETRETAPGMVAGMSVSLPITQEATRGEARDSAEQEPATGPGPVDLQHGPERSGAEAASAEAARAAAHRHRHTAPAEPADPKGEPEETPAQKEANAYGPGSPGAAAVAPPPVVAAPAPRIAAPAAPASVHPDLISGEMPHLPEGVKQWYRNSGPVRMTYRICVNPAGRVSLVTPLGGAPGAAFANESIVATLRKWTYKPLAATACVIKTFSFMID